jgi:hypothetical protein
MVEVLVGNRSRHWMNKQQKIPHGEETAKRNRTRSDARDDAG